MYKILEKELWGDDLNTVKPAIKNIYYKGNVGLLNSKNPKLAIVGTRRITEYGGRVIEKWMSKFIDEGIIIVSGFMYGVDQKAHGECLRNGGKTIAVLGWGIDWKVSDSDSEMYEKILEKDGLILSEYEGESIPELWKFPQRNRIVVGLVDAVLVIEGAEKSGSMITAKLTKNFDKLLMAVPGPITSRVAEGTNNLIKKGQAKMVTSAEDVLREMGLGAGQMSLGFRSLIARQQRLRRSLCGLVDGRSSADPVLEILMDEPKSVDELARILHLPINEVLVKVTNLSLKGLVEERGGKYFVVC